MPRSKRAVRRAAPRPKRRPSAKAKGSFVGRDPSPVLDRYPPRESPFARPALTTPPAAAAPPAPASSVPPSTPPVAGSPVPPSAGSLIRLDAPFDVDEFSSLLGQTTIRVTVPREDLPEVLRRVTEFMGFGIYVYAVTVRPAPSELLKSFVVELDRVDFSPEKGAWVEFVEKGVSDSPFGPTGRSE
jgi:hypothetical protein